MESLTQKLLYVGLRAGLQRHLGFNIVSDPVFKESNDTFSGIFKWISRQGLDVVSHHEPIDPKDIQKFKDSGIIGTNEPLALQRLNWLNIAIHFGRRGRESYREMTKSTFVIAELILAYCTLVKVGISSRAKLRFPYISARAKFSKSALLPYGSKE